jgi:hypothetical protein
MEDLHLTAEDPDADEASRNKTKKIGATAVEAKPSYAESRQQPEHIGQMLLNSESAPAKPVAKKAPEHRPVPVTGQNIETLSRSELLNLSEAINVDGSTLRQIYETHLIGERGLRRLVSEHLHGGDLKKALRNEVTEREIDFERDPAVRDIRPGQALSAGGARTNKAALDKLLQKAGTNVADSGEETAFFKARARYEANELQQHKQQRRMVDITVAVVIALLLALIIFLYLSRK